MEQCLKHLTSFKRWLFIGFVLIGAAGLVWLMTTRHPAVWAIRNTIQYYSFTWGWEVTGQVRSTATGSLEGMIFTSAGEPITGAWVIVAEWDGTTQIDRSDDDGHYQIDRIPAGSYRPVVAVPGYESQQLGGSWGVLIEADSTTTLDARLSNLFLPPLSPGTDFFLAAPRELTCHNPIEAGAIERQVHFKSAGVPNQATFYYTPMTANTTADLPTLLAIYPGPAESWSCVSLILAQAGYAVVAAGPAYTFDFEATLDELQRLLQFVREQRFPGSDRTQLGLLGGSYSGIHVQRLLQRGETVKAALLLGPPTDLFDLRRRQEEGSLIPPFGLDRAFIALGFPNRNPLLYLQYSGAYHVRADFPPLALLHSRGDDVVPYQQSELLAANLELVGAPYELYYFEQGGHYLLAETADADTMAIYEASLNFLARHLR
jgi:dipeptidyl aminopeptidase/acylaminoacyl peptidase